MFPSSKMWSCWRWEERPWLSCSFTLACTGWVASLVGSGGKPHRSSSTQGRLQPGMWPQEGGEGAHEPGARQRLEVLPRVAGSPCRWGFGVESTEGAQEAARGPLLLAHMCWCARGHTHTHTHTRSHLLTVSLGLGDSRHCQSCTAFTNTLPDQGITGFGCRALSSCEILLNSLLHKTVRVV